MSAVALHISPSPHLRAEDSTARIMWSVVISLGCCAAAEAASRLRSAHAQRTRLIDPFLDYR